MADEVIVVRDDRRYKVLVTSIGQAKIARAALEGRKVNIVQMAVGDGNGGYYMPTPEMTELKREVWRGDIARKEINKNSPNMVDVRTVLDSTVGGFTVREASLIDDEGDTIVIGNMPDIEKVVILEGISSSLTVVLHVAFTNLDAVEIKVSPALDMASMKDVGDAIAAHNADPMAHGGTSGDGGRVIVASRVRDPSKPDYGVGGGGDAEAVALHVGPYTGSTEAGVVVSGELYDAENVGFTGDSHPDGTILINKTEV